MRTRHREIKINRSDLSFDSSPGYIKSSVALDFIARFLDILWKYSLVFDTCILFFQFLFFAAQTSEIVTNTYYDSNSSFIAKRRKKYRTAPRVLHAHRPYSKACGCCIYCVDDYQLREAWFSNSIMIVLRHISYRTYPEADNVNMVALFFSKNAIDWHAYSSLEIISGISANNVCV